MEDDEHNEEEDQEQEPKPQQPTTFEEEEIRISSHGSSPNLEDVKASKNSNQF